MKINPRIWSFMTSAIVLLALNIPAVAQGPAGKPNILFIMADDIGWMQVQAYADGMASGKHPTSTASRKRVQGSSTMSPCKAARRDATRSSPACIRCVPA